MKKITQLIALALCLLLPFNAIADNNDGKAHKLVIQVSTNDPQTQKIALNNAVNVQKDISMDNIDIEIVAYGPGLSVMTAQSPEAKRVSSLTQQGITFSACNNTMKKMAKKSGKMPVLADGVGIVPAGVIRIMELQEKGYAYIRP